MFASLIELHAEVARFGYDVVELVDGGVELVELCDAVDDALIRIQAHRDAIAELAP